MSLNWKEIDLVLSEWNIIGSKIQQVLQPTPSSLFIEVYIPYPHAKLTSSIETSPKNSQEYGVQYIYISLENGKVRMHHCSHRIKKPKVAQRFQQLLQSRIIGMTIQNIVHVNKDRIIQFTLSSTRSTLDNSQEENKSAQTLLLYSRLWSNQANILLTNTENAIIDLAFRRPKQSLMPGQTFIIPQRSPNKTEQNTQIREDYSSEHTPSFNAFIEEYYANKNKSAVFDNTKLKYEIAYNKQYTSLTDKLHKIQSSIAKYNEQLASENYGNLILAHMHNIKPNDAMLKITTLNTSTLQEEIIIPLNTLLSPAENAQYYFKQLQKAKQNRLHLQEQQTLLEQKLTELLEIQTLIKENTFTLSDQQQNLLFPKEMRQEKYNEISVNRSGIKIFFHDGPYLLMAGRNVKENDILLRKYVKGKDIWLHVRGYTGCYVFIRASGNKSIPLEMLKKGGQIAALYSKAKNETYADIYYTPVKYLKRVKKSPGLVIPMRDSNLQIKVNTAEIKQYLHEHTMV